MGCCWGHFKPSGHTCIKKEAARGTPYTCSKQKKAELKTDDCNNVKSDTLHDALHRVEFRNFGLTLRSHRFEWETVHSTSGGAG